MERNRKISFIYFTDKGGELALQYITCLTELGFAVDAADGRGRMQEWTHEHFCASSVLVFIGAAGIAVRTISPFIKDKFTDPAVIVIDEKGEFVIPILSGHVGGANQYARLLATLGGGTPVITTATDVNGLFAVDVFAARNGLVIGDREAAKRFSASLLQNTNAVKAKLLIPESLKDDIVADGNPPAEISLRVKRLFEQVSPAEQVSPTEDCLSAGAACITPFETTPYDTGILRLIPKMAILGVGCRTDQDPEELISFAGSLLKEHELDPRCLKAVATIDIKIDEPAVKKLAEHFGVPLLTFSAEELAAAEGEFHGSAFVEKTTGVDNVCERAAAAAGACRILVPKRACDGMTAAVGICKARLRF